MAEQNGSRSRFVVIRRGTEDFANLHTNHKKGHEINLMIHAL